MKSIIESGRIGQFNDLHIDQIDPEWKDKKRWIDAGLEAFRIATGLRSHDRLPVEIALAFSLRAGDEPRGVDFCDAKTLFAQLDWSPPSLYLLSPGREPWAWRSSEGAAAAPSKFTAKEVDLEYLGISQYVKSCYFMEFKPSDSDEYARTLLLIG